MPRTVNSDMLVLAREAANFTQGELAKLVGASQARLSKYENGLLEPDHDSLVRLSKALGVSIEFFYQTDSVYGLGSSLLFNRKKKTVPLGVQKRVQARVNIARMQIDRLLRGAEIEQSRRFQVLDVDAYDKDVERIAGMVRLGWGIPVGPIVNLTAIVESAGGVVVKCNFETEHIDATHLWLPGLPPLFFINSGLSSDRYRFTLAHEIGHAVMHTHPSTGDIEKEANRFASALLMPAEQIRHQLRDMSVSVAARLKPIWKTSMASIIRRAHVLECIDANRYQSLLKHLGALGYRRNEPIPLPEEHPQIVPQLIELYRTRLGYSDADFGRLLYTTQPTYLNLDARPALSLTPTRDTYAFPGSRAQA